MSIIGHGIDIADCSRLEQMIQRHGERILKRLFTDKEQEYCLRYKLSGERFAGRFAVKEAVLKALGTGWRDGIAWTDIETTNDSAGKPEVNLAGLVAQKAQELGITQIHISISHTNNLAMASVIAWGSD